MKHYKILYIIILFSCSNSNEITNTNNTDKPITHSILINASSILDTVDISDLIDSIRIIKIKETNEGLIGGIEKLFVNKNNYVIFDPDFSNKIVIYNTNGEFVKNLVKMGAGPEELSKLSDVWVNEREELEVYDNYLNKILVYDYDFNVSKTIFMRNSNLHGSIIKISSKSQYVTYSGYNGFFKNNQFFKLAILDSAFNINKLFFPYSNNLNRALISIPISAFFVFNDTVGFTQNFDPSVYNIYPSGDLIKKYELIYSPNPFPSNFESEIVAPNLSAFKSDVIDFKAINELFSGFTGYRGPWLESSKYAIFRSFDSKYTAFTSIYDKERKEILYQAKNFSETNQYHMQIPPYFYTTNASVNRFISFYEGFNVLLLLKESSPFYEMVKNDVESFYIIDISFK